MAPVFVAPVRLQYCSRISLYSSVSRISNRVDIAFVRQLLYNTSMLLGFKTELKLNNVQRTLLAKHAGTARHAWNWGLRLTKEILGHNIANPDTKLKFPSAIDLHKYLIALVKPENPPAAIAFRRATAEKLAGGTLRYLNALLSMHSCI